MVWEHEPIVEEVEECFEFLASNFGDGDCGVVCCPFLGACLLFVAGLWKGKHILENTSFRLKEVLVHTVQAAGDLNADQEIVFSATLRDP